MKILIVGNFSFEKWGGASIVANYLIREYKKSGHQVEVLSFLTGAAQREEKTFWGDRITLLKAFSGKLSCLLSQFLDIYNPWSIYLLKKKIREIKPDIVHLHNIHKDISAYGACLIHRLGIPVIITFHDFWALCPGFNLENNKYGAIRCRRPLSKFTIPFLFRNFLIKNFVSDADYIFVPSNFARQRFLERGYAEKKVKCIYNGVDINLFTPSTEKDDKKNRTIKIIFVGRATRKKGVEFLQKACEELKAEGLSFILEIIGGEKDVSYFDLPNYYRRADICVQPSLVHETFGLTIVEAMACALPVVVTNMGGMSEVGGDAGVVVRANDINSLKTALKDLIQKPHQRISMGAKGRQRVETIFNWRKSAQKYLNYMQNLVNQR